MKASLAHLEPGNRRLLFVTLALALACVAGWLGPAATALDAAREAREHKRAEFERWQADFVAYRPILASEREQWQASYTALGRWVPAVSDEPQLVAEVARAVQTPSTKELQVLKGEPLEDRTDAPPEQLELRAPDGVGVARLRAVPLSLQFRCKYPDLVALLGRLQAKQIPARVDALHLKRLFGDIEVRIELVFFVREGPSA